MSPKSLENKRVGWGVEGGGTPRGGMRSARRSSCPHVLGARMGHCWAWHLLASQLPSSWHTVLTSYRRPCHMGLRVADVCELEARASSSRDLARLMGGGESYQGAFLFQHVKTALIWTPGLVGL